MIIKSGVIFAVVNHLKHLGPSGSAVLGQHVLASRLHYGINLSPASTLSMGGFARPPISNKISTLYNIRAGSNFGLLVRVSLCGEYPTIVKSRVRAFILLLLYLLVRLVCAAGKAFSRSRYTLSLAR